MTMSYDPRHDWMLDEMARNRRPIAIVALPLVEGDLCDETVNGHYCGRRPYITAETAHHGVRILCRYHAVVHFPNAA